MIRRLFRLLLRTAAAAFGLAALYLGAALALGTISVNRDFQATPNGIEIAVCSNGVHTDFVLPVKTAGVDWSAFFPPADYPADVTRFDHIGIGWGDLDFYRSTPRWSDFDIGIALYALTGLGRSALHVQYRHGPGPNEDCRQLQVSAEQYRKLEFYIIVQTASPPAPPMRGYGTTDLFYPVWGRFSLFKSCNVWVGNGLKESGLPAGLWTPFSFQVLSHL